MSFGTIDLGTQLATQNYRPQKISTSQADSTPNCVSARLECTYDAIPQKKGPKGSRAKVLSKLHKTQRNTQLAAGFPTDLRCDGLSLPSTFARTQGLLPPALVESCIEYFFNNFYPTEPVLQHQKAQEAVDGMDRSTEAYCMIVALCAYVIIQANHKPHANVLPRQEITRMFNVGIGHVLLEESCPDLVFYYGCYLGLALKNTALTYLREATTQAQLLGMHDEETYKYDLLDESPKRALYWLLSIAERTCALHTRRSITLHPLMHLTSLDEVPSDQLITIYLELIINMFKIIDDGCIKLSKGVHETNESTAWILQVQTRLSEAVPADLECTEAQEVQIRTTQQWLMLSIWELGVNQGLVNEVNKDPSLTYICPIDISRELLTTLQQFPKQVMQVHGVGLIEKLFDVACCLIDAFAWTNFSPDAFTLGSRDYVSCFLTLISNLSGGQSQYLPCFSPSSPKVLDVSTLGLNSSGSEIPHLNLVSASATLSSSSHPSNTLNTWIAPNPISQLHSLSPQLP
ncbi:c6 zinc finger domain containing protein [Pyrenophora tritici-repentis]|nr:c6 zinc finger domain containing protein [Pyrenophora tritici-repentis]